VRIEGGRFEMGSRSGDKDEKPVHEVRVKTLWLAKTEVTVGQYGRCVRAGKCSEPDAYDPDDKWKQYCNWDRSGRENHPVNCVSWKQAVAYSRWAGGRLPSEAEWEYAARSRGKAWKYPWGNEKASCRRAVMHQGGDGCGKDGTWPVCSKPRGNSEQGVCDLAGNVWEWVADWSHGSYVGAPRDGSAWVKPVGSMRVLRGGSWYAGAAILRAASRHGDMPSNRTDHSGFRPARSAYP